jgi:Domain of unknown function (DUF1772)
MIFSILQVVTLILITLALALALAHAVELPGKMRLSREAYLAVQPIYYPGFTIGGGIGEAGGTVLTILVLVFTPVGSAAFWLTLVALLGLIGMQGAYWVLTHPVNRVWLRGERLSGFSSRFFAFGKKRGDVPEPEWTELRDRWEYSHVVRAGLAFVSFVAVLIALLLNGRS